MSLIQGAERAGSWQNLLCPACHAVLGVRAHVRVCTRVPCVCVSTCRGPSCGGAVTLRGGWGAPVSTHPLLPTQGEQQALGTFGLVLVNVPHTLARAPGRDEEGGDRAVPGGQGHGSVPSRMAFRAASMPYFVSV